MFCTTGNKTKFVALQNHGKNLHHHVSNFQLCRSQPKRSTMWSMVCATSGSVDWHIRSRSCLSFRLGWWRGSPSQSRTSSRNCHRPTVPSAWLSLTCWLQLCIHTPAKVNKSAKNLFHHRTPVPCQMSKFDNQSCAVSCEY